MLLLIVSSIRPMVTVLLAQRILFPLPTPRQGNNTFGAIRAPCGKNLKIVENGCCIISRPMLRWHPKALTGLLFDIQYRPRQKNRPGSRQLRQIAMNLSELQ
ncbi:MAG: hypothetical protein KGJ88_12615 [Verrucomicrobiota bacterium]|nr:hypothetical protein [Verrucomicrobiota bacterium]